MELFFAPENIFFTVAIGLLISIALLEGIGTLLGFAFMGLVDGLLPSIDLGLDSSLEIGHPFSMGKLMSWLQLGRVPAILILIGFLASFGLTGLGIQAISFSFFSGYIPLLIVTPIAFVASLPSTRLCAKALCYVLPKDESSAIRDDSLIGRTAVIILGTARKGQAVEAKVRDAHGRTHYLMVEPDNDEDEFSEGAQILLVKKTGSIFYGITPSKNLFNET
jgi:hypothetical protein